MKTPSTPRAGQKTRELDRSLGVPTSDGDGDGYTYFPPLIPAARERSMGWQLALFRKSISEVARRDLTANVRSRAYAPSFEYTFT